MTTPKSRGGLLFQTQPVTVDLCAAAREAHLDAPVGVLWKEPQPGEFWQHFKGGIYRILALAADESTKDRVVVYTGDSGTWTRPLSEFLGNVYRGGYDGPRFVPAEVPHQREIEALRRVVRAFAHGTIGKTVDPTGNLKHWWGACGFIHGATLPEVLKNLAQSTEDSMEDPAQRLEELAAVEAALKDTSNDGE